MVFVHSLSLFTTLFPPRRHSLPIKGSIFPKLSPQIIRISPTVLIRSAPKLSLSATEQDILKAVAQSNEKSLPCVRTYENDLARLTLVGAVDFQQALSAAAADGGEAAAEHIASGMLAMVVETVFPGPADERTTVSTRLFLPARKVKEKAKRLRSTLTEDFLSSTSSRNILAMTFRQVVLQQLWNFELLIFRPGTERNMEDLISLRQVCPSFTLDSSDERVISVLAEVICLSALEGTQRNFLDKSLGIASRNILHCFHKPKRIISKDSSVILSKLLEEKIIMNAKSLLETFNSEKANHSSTETNLKYNWWTSTAHSKLEKIGGSKFSLWTSEYIPAYQLQIDADKLHSVKLEGWTECAENGWEVLLTHHQLVSLASILDMHYEDQFTLPGKQLPCDFVTKSTNFSINKKKSSLLKILYATLVGGFFLVTISILGQLCLPHLHSGRKYPRQNHSLQLSDVENVQYKCLESTKSEALCMLIIKRINDAFGWPGEVTIEPCGVAWTGELPKNLRGVGRADFTDTDISSTPSEKCNELKAPGQDIASYQVVLSASGKVIGFQPTNRVAVNHWAANPLAKELHGGRKLSPGFIEPGIKNSHPSDVVLLDLVMSVNRDSFFALARPIESSLLKIAGEN